MGHEETPETEPSVQPAIRRAKLQDAPHLKACIERAYAPVKSTQPDLSDVWFGVAGGAALGLSGASARLMNIAVDPDFKGKGIGRRMIEDVEAFAAKGGAGEIHRDTCRDAAERCALFPSWLE